MSLFLYSLLHFLVDGLCALAMFGVYFTRPEAAVYAIVYNFCAFALQLPLGAAADLLSARLPEKISRRLPALYALSGTVLVLAGCFTHPAVLGVGNALFHIGGGLDTMRADLAGGKKGLLLGVFVAPGALGLFLGKTAAGTTWAMLVFGLLAAALAVLCLLTRPAYILREISAPEPPARNRELTAVLCCFLVVILRGWLGFSVSMPWKTGLAAGAAAVLCIAGGKSLGGVPAAKFPRRIVMTVSLCLAGIGYVLSGNIVCGLLALLLFNMTMPVTLYMPVSRRPALAATFFGLLTMGLFLGYVPVWAGLSPPLSGGVIGAAVCGVSVILLLIADRCAGAGA